MLALIISMISFSLSMSISPGPVNLTILSSSMNYGVKPVLAFISGATFGFTLLLASVCFGLYQFIMIYPVLLNVISLLGTALLVWIGFNILMAKGERITGDISSTEQSVSSEKSMTAQVPGFMQGALMQWLNPKAWIAAVAGTALFSASQNPKILVLFILIYFVVCYLSLWIWGVAGELLAAFLNTGHRARIFNIVMGLVLIVISLHMCWTHFYGQNSPYN
ncbi:LysE family translocator [Acinetobacter chinensis]|uniref:LysE family translocator n=1 Tax=Acinetobacter chinensis TaxID=2004650 RepID=A0ABU3WG53_9GAMM|nr:LysE family translocator [Acinetobacter chinensis]MDV2468822.1 LysE family translocator [Acinetobacter chinensis]